MTLDAGTVLNVVYSVKAGEAGEYSFVPSFYIDNNGNLEQEQIQVTGTAVEL